MATHGPPSISFLIIARNEENEIEETLRAVLEMDYPSEQLEIVVVDDGSTDRTAAIAQKYPVKLLRIPHGGIARAKNAAIYSATGHLIAGTDAHDPYLDKNLLCKVAEALAVSGDEYDLIRFDAYGIPKQGWLSKAIFIHQHGPHLFRFGSKVAYKYKDALMRRAFIVDNNLTYSESVMFGEDMDFGSRLLQLRPRIFDLSWYSVKAIGGGSAYLEKMIQRELRNSHSALLQAKTEPMRVLRYAIWSTYLGAMPLVLWAGSGGSFLLLYLAPFLFRTTYRVVRLLQKTRMKECLAIPLLDLIQGYSILIGLMRGLLRSPSVFP